MATLMGFTNARFERPTIRLMNYKVRRSREILERLVRTRLSKDVIAAPYRGRRGPFGASGMRSWTGD